MLRLPELLNHFSLYNEAEQMIGITGAVDLPELSMMTDTISGSGVLGEIEESATGQFESMEMTIRWSCLSKEYFKAANTAATSQFTLRASLQCLDTDTGLTDYYPCKIVVRGKAKTLTLGSAEGGKKMECETTLEVYYIKIVIDNETVLEVDKLNFRYILNGVDMLEKIRAQI